MKQNNFIIVTPFYNVEKWINTTIASVKSQTYKNYKIYFCDDLSKDNSSDVVKKHVDNERIFLIENTEKKLALRNICETIEIANPNDEDIIITLDGDDWFSRNDALEVVNSYYQDDTLMTYGTYIDYPTGRIPHNVRAYSEEVVKNSSYRDVAWQASHLRTFKYGLWKRIRQEDLKDSLGNYYEMAWDLAFMFPMLEMASTKAKFVKEKLYCYNVSNPINDHKVDHSKQLRLDREIRQKQKYDSLINAEKNTKINPLNFLNYNRFDIAAKIIYGKTLIKKINVPFAKNLYLQHLKVWNNFNENEPIKKNKEDFLKSYETTLLSIKNNGFNPSYGKIPVYNNSALNGAHRIASSILCNEKVDAFEANLSSGQHISNYEYFKNKVNFVKTGLDDQYMDEMALEFCRNKSNLFTITLFPSHNVSKDLLYKTIKTDCKIVYEKEIKLSSMGKLNFVNNLYHGETWTGNKLNNYLGIQQKSSLCFKSGNTIKVFLVEEDSLQNLVNLKKRIRDICGVGNHSIHINDTQEETWRIASSVFNKNSINMLNNRKWIETKNFDFYFEKYKNLLQNSKSKEDFCVDSSCVLSAYGLRDCRDLDFLHLNNIGVLADGISCHNEEEKYYHLKKEEIIYDPKNHFYFFGVKFASLEIVKKMKINRAEPKDIKDLQIIGK